MASYLGRRALPSHLLRGVSLGIWPSRLLSTGALVELKPGEIGMASGIPQEHLRRKQLGKALKKLGGGR